MDHDHCLNCSAPVSGNFCANCGQKTDTHRITLKHFLLHDLLHGVWHLERGILFTLKETFQRPGQAALDYVGGKRTRYYNVFYLCLLVIGLNLLLLHYYENYHPGGMFDQGNRTEFMEFFSKYIRLIVLGVVPVLALNAWLVFRRMKLNLAEHCILGGICLLGMLVLSVFFNFFNFLEQFNSGAFIGILEVLVLLVLLLFPIWPYANAIKGYYSFSGTLWRLSVFYLMVILEICLILSYLLVSLNDGAIEINSSR